MALICYGFYLFVLPKVLTSPSNVATYQALILENSGLPVTIDGLKVKTYPDLSFKISTSDISAADKNKSKLANINGLKYRANLLNLKHGELTSDYIFADIPKLKSNLKLKPKKEKKSSKLSFFPKTNIKKAHIIISDTTVADVDYIKSKKHFGKIRTQMLVKISNPYTRTPVLIGQTGAIEYTNKVKFDNFSLKLDDSKFYLTGDTSDLKVKGNDLPVAELERSFLYFYKLKNPGKKNFLENFSDFKGTLDIDLALKNKDLTGICTTNNLGANFFTYKIPVYLPKTNFYFKNKKITASTKGTFGGEPVTTDFILTGLFSDNLHVYGDVHSPFTNKITKRYYPAVRIAGVADADVKYHTHNGTVDVYYTLKVNKGSNILSDYGNLDNTDKVRTIFMHTIKHGDPIKMDEFDYFIGKCNLWNGLFPIGNVPNKNGTYRILYGDGLFNKIKGHYKLSNVSLKSNGKVSVNYIKSFMQDYISNGSFDTNLYFDADKKKLSGNMNLYNVSHENFLYLKNTNLKMQNDKIILASSGLFYGSPYKAYANLSNDIRTKILVHNINVHLNSFLVQKGKVAGISKTFKHKKTKPKTAKKKINIVVENGNASVDRIYNRKFDVNNVTIQGSLKNNVADFVMPNASYAGGVLKAKGWYNIADTWSDIKFFASGINSNTVVTKFFFLPDQVTGTAAATLHVKTKNKLNDIKAKATFAISDGYLPKIANQEFIIGKSKKKNSKPTFLSKLNIKTSISKLINIDFSKPDSLYTDINGSFDVDNEYMSNIKLFARQDLLAMFIEGDYNIENQCGKLNLWGKRNRTKTKSLRILKIPINIIYRIVFRPEHTHNQYADKIKLIPPVKSSIADDIDIFHVYACGDLNDTDNLKIIMKDIR